MYIEELKPSNLAKELLIFNYVFVDTCSLMEDSFPAFMDLLVKSKSYWKGELEVVILGEVLDELKKHSANREKPDLRVSALRALKIINHDTKLFGKHAFTIWKSKSDDGFLDNALYTIVSGLRIKNKILVITQDKTLAKELRSMNDLESQRGRYIIIKRINKDGALEENPGDSGYKSQSRKNGGANAPKLIAAPKKERKELPAPKDVKEIKQTPKVSDSLLALQANDKRISANISNPNYPTDRKINDINNQLSLINKENKKDVSSLNLVYDGQKLSETLKKLSENLEKKPVETKKKEEAKPEQKAPKKAKAEPKAWFEFGSTSLEATIKACTSNSIIPHKKEVEYVRAVHGEANIVIEDLQSRLDKFKFETVGESHELRFNSYLIKVEKTEKDFKATIEKSEAPKKEPKLQAKPEKGKPALAPVKEEVKVVEEPKAEEPKKKEPKQEKKKKQTTPKKKEEKPVKEPKPVEKPVEEKIEEQPAEKVEKRSPELEDALASEKVLRCNVNNPNYPVESKVKSLESQLAKARALKESDRRKLGWGIRELQRRLSELKK